MKGIRRALALAALVGTAACGGEPAGTQGDVAALVSVTPGGNAVSVSFTHAMPQQMSQYMVLHEGGVTGTVVPGTWSWSADGLTATFTPAAALKARTQYTLHVGGGMMDQDGMKVDLALHGSHHGGTWATGSMMTGSGMMGGGMMGGGMMADSSMMGPGWKHENGSYGMVFTFTTP